MVIFPKDLYYEKPYVGYIDFFTTRNLFGLLLISVTMISILKRKKWPKFALGSSLFFVAIAPFSGIIPLNAIFLEHWLYVPMVGLSLLVAAFVELVVNGKPSKIMLLFLLFLLSIFSIRTYLRAAEWGNIEKFYLNEIEHGGNSVRMLNNLGMYYAEKSEVDKAIEYYKRAIKGSEVAHQGLSRITTWRVFT